MATERQPVKARKQPHDVRPVTGREHLIGAGLICLTLLICTWVLIRGLAPQGVLWGNYDPALFSDQSAAAPAASPAPAEPAAEPAPSAAPVPTADGPAVVLPIECPGWTAAAPQKWPAADMWEKINGRADAYLANECVQLEFADYTKGELGLDLYVFQHSDAKQAFAMFRGEKSDEVEPAEIGQEGYFSGTSLFFRQGAFYIQILGVSGQETKDDVLTLAKAVVAKLPADAVDIPALAWFPKDGRQDGSLGYVKDSALGQEWLNDVYTIEYGEGDAKLTAFLTKRGSPAEATDLLGKYRGYLESMGQVSEGEVAGGTQLIGDLSGMYDLVFAKGDYFGGVTYTADRAGAEALAKRILEQL